MTVRKTPAVMEPIGKGESGRFSLAFPMPALCLTACISHSHSHQMLRTVDSRFHVPPNPQMTNGCIFSDPEGVSHNTSQKI